MLTEEQVSTMRRIRALIGNGWFFAFSGWLSVFFLSLVVGNELGIGLAAFVMLGVGILWAGSMWAGRPEKP